ncbi:MAG TPA: amidase family protein, partial [Burkholderiaceae bacterium]|nr:amidase family protein [Burkholderiaceae bacterium]
FMGRVAGPMTRSVADSALMMDVLSRPDPRDWMSLPYQPLQFAQRLDGIDLKGLRIGFLAEMGVGLPVHPEVAAAVSAAARALESAGAIVEPVRSFLTPEMFEAMFVWFEARSCRDVASMPDAQRAKILPFVLEWCTWRARQFSGNDVMRGYQRVMAMREAAVAAVARYDFVLSPTSPIPAYDADAPSPTRDPHDALPHIAFTVPYNMSEQPAASVNWDFTGDGLPIGVQLIGQRFDDAGVMRLARALEHLRPPQRPWPEPPQR